MILLLDTNNLEVKVRNSCFEITIAEQQRLIATTKVEGIIVSANVLFNSKAMHLAFQNDIPIYYLDRFGAVVGICRKANFNNASVIRRNQVQFIHSESARAWVKEIFQLKFEGQKANLNYIAECKPSLSKAIVPELEILSLHTHKIKKLKHESMADMRPSLLGLEGSVARMYWGLIAKSMPEQVFFKGRSQHPAKDVFNAALNYLYGILYTMVETAIFSTGLDPTLGVFHTDQYQKPTLAFDIIEPFRPWVDRFLVEFFWTQPLEQTFFKSSAEEVSLDKKGKSVLIPPFLAFMEQKTTFRNQICSRKTHIARMAGALALQLFNNPADDVPNKL
jgi:CRISPR-associated protein Cas1